MQYFDQGGQVWYISSIGWYTYEAISESVFPRRWVKLVGMIIDDPHVKP